MSEHDLELATDLRDAGIVIPHYVNGWVIQISGYFDRARDGLPSLIQSGTISAVNCLDRTFTDAGGVMRDAQLIGAWFRRDELRTAFDGFVTMCVNKPRGAVIAPALEA